MKTWYVDYKRKEYLDTAKVRNLCVENNFYTNGTEEEYSNMFDLCKKYSGSTDDLMKIAWDIVDHSDDAELDDYGFDTVSEIVAFIMTLLIQKCAYIVFISVEEEREV